ncbi:unnamed protein product [Haemonchus placei]|uniref:Lipocalin n=1 Tax=Haemonchus placei TaxID=6290 RepID=A0A158QKK7_HAEPC|nr:unnamed protein product [Haemonchus placei]
MLLAFVVAFVVTLHPRMCYSAQKWDHKKPIVTAFGDRNGHNYLFRVSLNEISFAQYPVNNFYKNDACVSFPTLRGTVQTCDKYFLLVDDWYKFDRKTWDKGFNNAACTILQFHTSVLVFIKYDVIKDTSPKFVGTYSTTRDKLYYFGKDNKMIIITNFSKRIDRKIMSPTKYEVICAVERKWP